MTKFRTASIQDSWNKKSGLIYQRKPSTARINSLTKIFSLDMSQIYAFCLTNNPYTIEIISIIIPAAAAIATVS